MSRLDSFRKQGLNTPVPCKLQVELLVGRLLLLLWIVTYPRCCRSRSYGVQHFFRGLFLRQLLRIFDVLLCDKFFVRFNLCRRSATGPSSESHSYTTGWAAMSEAIREVGLIYAPFLGGMMVGCFLFGITISQAIIYFRSFWDDTIVLRALVFWGIDDRDVLKAIHPASVQAYARLLSFLDHILTSCIPVSKNMWVALVLGALSLAQLVLLEDLFTKNTLFALHKPTSQMATTGTLTSTTLCDVGISLGLWFYLHRGRTGFAKTEKMIGKLILYMVNLGLLTSVASLLTLILLIQLTLGKNMQFLVMPHSFAFVALTLIRSRLYCNAMLAALNYREAVRTALHGGIHTSNIFQEVELDGIRSYNKGNERTQ
ncbi:hypothetical protein C8J57DRAFT_1243414 [Mycena rebaudengoi]|nr:hypothetical protein C8J57DRAFT_1243414 [Mycena rebaudengoi]